MIRRKTLAIAALAVCLSIPAGAQQHAFLWSSSTGLQDLGTLGGPNSDATAINDHGQVVGSSDLGDGKTFHAFRWASQDGMQDLGALNGHYFKSEATAINNVGQVVGSGLDIIDNSLAFLWTSAAGMKSLGTLGGIASAAYSINSFGQVVGWATDRSGDPHAFLWTARTGMRDLGTLGGDNSEALGINDSGQVVGDSLAPDGLSHVFLWTEAEGMKDLGQLGSFGCSAHSINAADHLVGYCDDLNGPRAIDSKPEGAINGLPLGRVFAIANAINGHGRVAGQFSSDGEHFHAFLWSSDQGLTDLGTLGGTFSAAQGINHAAQVVGYSDLHPGAPHLGWYTYGLNASRRP